MTHPVPTKIFIRLKRRVDKLDIEALSLICAAMKVCGFDLKSGQYDQNKIDLPVKCFS